MHFTYHFIVESIWICWINTQSVNSFNQTYVGFTQSIVFTSIPRFPSKLIGIYFDYQRIVILIYVHNVCPSEQTVNNQTRQCNYRNDCPDKLQARSEERRVGKECRYRWE